MQQSLKSKHSFNYLEYYIIRLYCSNSTVLLYLRSSSPTIHIIHVTIFFIEDNELFIYGSALKICL